MLREQGGPAGNTHILISNVELQVTLDVAGTKINYLVDTQAT